MLALGVCDETYKRDRAALPWGSWRGLVARFLPAGITLRAPWVCVWAYKREHAVPGVLPWIIEILRQERRALPAAGIAMLAPGMCDKTYKDDVRPRPGVLAGFGRLRNERSTHPASWDRLACSWGVSLGLQSCTCGPWGFGGVWETEAGMERPACKLGSPYGLMECVYCVWAYKRERVAPPSRSWRGLGD
jgi:hypothetical protein